MDRIQHNGQLCGQRHASGCVETTLADLDQLQQWRCKEYRVARYPQVEPGEDRWTCTCKGYRFRSTAKLNYHCKHIRELREWLIKQI